MASVIDWNKDDLRARVVKDWLPGRSASEIARWATAETGFRISRNTIIGQVQRHAPKYVARQVAEVAARKSQKTGNPSFQMIKNTEVRGKAERAGVRHAPSPVDLFASKAVKAMAPPTEEEYALEQEASRSIQALMLGTPKDTRDDQPVSFIDLKTHHCRYIIGNSDGIKTLFCGKNRAAGSSYCGEHHDICCTGKPVLRQANRTKGVIEKRSRLYNGY